MSIQNTFSDFFENFAHFLTTEASAKVVFAPFAVKKRLKSILVLIILFTATPALISGQSEKLSEIIINIAEELASDEDDPEAVSTFTEKLYELAENPVKINSSEEAEISRLFFLSDFQVKALADYVHTSGQIVSVYEIANIPGFDKETAEIIIPFVTLEYKSINNSNRSRLRNTVLSNLSLKSGPGDTSSLGSEWRMLTRYKFTAGKFSVGLTMEKDPGEKLLAGNPPLPDFLSANIAYNGIGVIRRIVIGDFSARFGQGTNINTGIRRGFSLTTPGYMSSSDEIKPYTSTEENRFFRGAGAEFSLKKFGLSAFFSKNNRDATISPSAESANIYIENFYTAGVHNTSALMNKKDAVSELAYGIALSYNINNLKFGLIWSGNSLSLPLKQKSVDPEKFFDFKGDKSNLYTFYYNSLIKRILLFGELSANNNSNIAIVQGMSFRPSDRLTLNFLYRNYSPGYTTFYGLGPGTGSKTANENGVAGSFSFEAARHLFISGGFDIEHFPWLKYRCSTPSLGVRHEIKVRYLPSERLAIDGFYAYRLSMTDNSEAQWIPDQQKLITRSFKASARYSVHNNLTIGTRIDYKIADPYGSKGMILLQEISYGFRNVPVIIWLRYCIFNTDDWNSRIYTYENDLLYSYSIPALYGEGSRSYIMVKWKIADFAELRVKYGITSSFTDGKSFDNREEIKLQVSVWF